MNYCKKTGSAGFALIWPCVSRLPFENSICGVKKKVCHPDPGTGTAYDCESFIVSCLNWTFTLHTVDVMYDWNVYELLYISGAYAIFPSEI